LIEDAFHIHPMKLLVGEIQDGSPVFRSQLMPAGAEIDTQMIRHAEQGIHRPGGLTRLNQRIDAGGIVVQTVERDKQS
jgi:hypothetical protein